MLYSLNQSLNEAGVSAFVDKYTSYEYLWDGATKFGERTNFLKAQQVITTTIGTGATQAYNINADFLKLYLMDNTNNFILGYTPAGASIQFVQWRQYDDIIYRGQSTVSNPVPSWWTVLALPTELSPINSTVTSTGALTKGTSQLTDSTASFLTSVAVGDRIHDYTDGSDGVILSITDNTHLTAALFNGTNNFFTNGDSYSVQTQGIVQLIVNPACSVAGDAITLYYIQRPAPVFSDLGVYNFPAQHINAIISYATWRYKYRDREPVFADHLYQVFEAEIKRIAQMYKSSVNKRDMRFTLRRRPGVPS